MRNLIPLTTLSLLSATLSSQACGALTTETLVLVEAESFDECGGWVVDQQFMDQMGSPYLLAHGLSVPVRQATTRFTAPSPGRYRVWVRTRDWVAPWNAPGAPGRFKLVVNGNTLSTTFGVEGAEWHWQDGGEVTLTKTNELLLRDLTGFEGRCDAILFSKDLNFVPPDGGEQLSDLRRALLGWDTEPADGGNYDLVVVGGGIAGTSAAITASRLGLRVALVQDRPVLGGNGSSEVRVWPEGLTNFEPYPHIGDVVVELLGPHRFARDLPDRKAHVEFQDRRKLTLAQAEPKLTLFLEQRVNRADARDGSVRSVVAQHIRTGKRTRLNGRWFLDSTGDGVLGALVGADFELAEKGRMGSTNLWSFGETGENEHALKCLCEDFDERIQLNFTSSTEPQPFPRCPWAADLSEVNFPGRERQKTFGLSGDDQLGTWFWESGFHKDPIKDAEWIRDLNLRAMYGAWDTLKNMDGRYPNHRLKWAAYIAGKRESRRLLGDVILTADDFRKGTEFQDAAFPCTWHIDIHSPHPEFFEQNDPNAFFSTFTRGKEYEYKQPYWAPYRCLYSRNIDNLFMAGRDISVTQDGLGAVRVMRTCGMMGEIVGMAASICQQFDCSPREVHESHLDQLQELMKRGAGKDSPAVRRTDEAASSPDFTSLIQPVPARAKFSDPDFYIWGASMVRDDNGVCHLLYSRWPRELGHDAWVTHSEIAHATSDDPLGPYRHIDVALPERGAAYWDGHCTHNPTVHAFEGRYYLYYMGNTGDRLPTEHLNWSHRNNQRIGVAVAEDPAGPWTRFDKPLIDVSPNSSASDALMTSNPTICRRPDGVYLLIYKAVGLRGPLPFGGPVVHMAATSFSPLGPFEKHPQLLFTNGDADFPAEDPFIWSQAGRCWAIVNDQAGAFNGVGSDSLSLFSSEDGLTWEPASHPLVSRRQLDWEDGTQELFHRLERPQLWFQRGKPSVLFCAAEETSEKLHSSNVHIPLRQPQD